MSNTPTSEPPSGNRHLGDLLFAMGSKVFYALSRVALTPLILVHVSLSEYGLWAASFVLVSYLGMSASGFTNVYLRQVAQHHAQGDTQAISRLLSTGILTMASIATLLLGGLYLSLPAILSLFKVDEAMRGLATMLWMGSAAIFMVDLSFGAFSNTLHALGRIRDEQKIWLRACFLELALILSFLHIGWGIRGLLLAFGLRYAYSGFSAIRQVRQHLPSLQLRWQHVDRALLPMFLWRGGSFQIADMMGTALHSFDRLIAGALLGPHATAVFDLAAKLPVTAASAPSSVNAITTSIAARHDAQSDVASCRLIYFDALRMSALTLGLILPFMAAFSTHFAQAWMGNTPVMAALMQVLPVVCVGMHWHMLTGPSSAMFRGQGRIAPDYLYHGCRAAAFGMSLLTWHEFASPSLHSLACALALAQIAAGLTYLIWSYRRLAGTCAGLMSQVLLPTLIAYAAAFVMLASWGQPHGPGRMPALLELAALGLVWLALGGVLAWHGLLREDERERVLARLHPWLTAIQHRAIRFTRLARPISWRKP